MMQVRRYYFLLVLLQIPCYVLAIDLQIETGDTKFYKGDTLNLSAGVNSDEPETIADIYLSILFPNYELRFLEISDEGNLIVHPASKEGYSWIPFYSNLHLPAGEEVELMHICSHTLNGTELPGNYQFTLTVVPQGQSDIQSTSTVVLAKPKITRPTPGRLNDTGIIFGGDYPSGNNEDCTGTTIKAQDCSHGRDYLYNDNSDGYAGFNFTKLDSEGNGLAADVNSWQCVMDNVTGLIWEVKKPSGLHYYKNTYTWYNPDGFTNGGDAGVQNGGSFTGSACDTLAFVQAVNIQGLCGAKDWRLPTLEELGSIVALGFSQPAIDSNYFPNTPWYSTYFWSSTPSAHWSDHAWVVGFGSGVDHTLRKDLNEHIRLVRTAP